MLKQYIVDAFTDSIFHGNPAAVCILQEWPSDDLMIKIAAENNLSETAFTVKEGARYRLRWFTPSTEIDLCGHATLATAYVLLNYYEQHVPQIVFDTLSGDLTVQRHGDLYEMDFPAYGLHEVPVTDEMEKTLGIRPLEAWMGRDLLCLLPAEDDVRAFVPDAEKTLHLPGLILHTTAQGKDADYVLRSYAPKLGIAEDPVCGSGNCHTAPFWADRLKKTGLEARQCSKRGGTRRLDGCIEREQIRLIRDLLDRVREQVDLLHGFCLCDGLLEALPRLADHALRLLLIPLGLRHDRPRLFANRSDLLYPSCA